MEMQKFDHRKPKRSLEEFSQASFYVYNNYPGCDILIQDALM